MRIHPLSDLHLGHIRFGDGELNRSATTECYLGIDVLVAAGDIHVGTKAPGLLRRLYPSKRILYVAGNHEYYGNRLDLLDDQLREECRRHDVDYLQCDSVEIDGVVILGCTLWTDFAAYAPVVSVSKAGRMTEGVLNDYRAIQTMSKSRGVPRRIRWQDTVEVHKRHRTWLEKEITCHRGKPLVIVTHHAPSLALCHPEYRNDPVTAAFCNRMGDFVEQCGANYWICGHTHWPEQVRIGKTLVVNNSCGYPGELSGERYDPSLILEI
jgi:predicted phosphodiesterase